MNKIVVHPKILKIQQSIEINDFLFHYLYVCWNFLGHTKAEILEAVFVTKVCRRQIIKIPSKTH